MTKEMFCKNCGYQGKPKVHTPGYFAVELILWFLFILPGLAYSLWRASNRSTICPKCRQLNMIPINSPIAQKIIRETSQPSPPVKTPELEPSAKKEPDINLPERDENGRFIIPES